MSKPPLISIITVVFNGEATLEKTIQSVLNQKYAHKEYIIIDGNSTDLSVEIIRKYESQLSYWISEPDNGLYDAMNKGLAQSTGDLVGILNADDYYEPGALTKVSDVYSKENTSPDVIYGNLRYHNARGEQELLTSVEQLQLHHFSNMPILHPTAFTKRTLCEELNYFNTRYNIIADLEFMLRAYQIGAKFCYIDEVLAGMHAGGVSEQRLLESLKEYEELLSQIELPMIVHIKFTMRKLRTYLHDYLLHSTNGNKMLKGYLSLKDRLS